MAHRLEKHMDGKEICCPNCDKKITEWSLLKVHIDKMHPDHGNMEKKFSCDDCDRRFIFEKSLKYHQFGSHKKENHVCLYT